MVALPTLNNSRRSLHLRAVGPFRLDLTAWALRRRAANMVDRWDGLAYSRTVAYADMPVRITASQISPDEVKVILESKGDISPAVENEIRLLIRRTFGLNIDLQSFYALTAHDRHISGFVQEFKGVKPPRFPSLFEALVNAIACQQVSLDAAIIILNRFAENLGFAFEDRAGVTHAFPRPEDVADASEEKIKSAGFSTQKAHAIRKLAKDVLNRRLNLASLEEMTDSQAKEYLLGIRGIGRWSAEYVLLRGLGRLDTFPGDDIGAQNNLQRIFGLPEKPGYEEIKKLTSAWQPFQGMVYFHLLLNKLQARGAI